MAWSLQAGTGKVATFSSDTVALPASVTAGDLLLLLADGASDLTATVSGYTELFTDFIAGDRFYVFGKTAGGSESNPTLVWAGSNVTAAVIVRVRGGATTVDQLTAQTSTTTTASINPTDTGAIKIGVVHIDPNTTGGAVTWSGGTTGLVDVPNAAAAHVGVGYKEEDTAGAMTFTYSGTTNTPGTLIFSIAGSGGASTFVPRVMAVT